MMGKMRDMTKWILYILIFAFVGLMVVEWGADYSGIRRRTEFLVGEIDGQEITLEQFNQSLRYARFNEEQRNGGKNLTDEQANQLRNQVWEELIQRILLQKEIKKLNIQVTNEDVTNYVQAVLYQQYRDDPNFQTDGQFDEAKFNQVLADESNRAQLLNMEEQARQNLPYSKLLNIINASVIIPEEEIRAEYEQQNIKAKIDFLAVPIASFSKEEIETSDEEALKYYQKNKEDFKTQETRRLNYVYFSTVPTVEDTAKIYQRAEEIKKEALAGKDFSELANAESADPSAATNHGDLGYFERKDMVKEFSDAAFTAKPGEIIGPVKTQFGLHIIKVIDKKTENGMEKVHAAHILLKFEPSYNTTDEAQRKSELFSETAKEDGFTLAADKLGVEIKQTTEFSNNKIGQIPGLGKMESTLMWAFNSEKDAISDVYYMPQGYYIFQLTDIKPAGYRPFEEVKEICKNRIKLEKLKDLAKEYAEKIKPQVEQNSNFQQIVDMDTEHIISTDTTGYFPMNVFVPKIGRAPSVAAAAFNLPLNQTSGMLETDRGYYFIRVTGRTEFNEEDYARQREAIRNRILQQKARTIYTQWFEKLKEQANIKDYRYRFFRS